jgi:hypothetical protein
MLACQSRGKPGSSRIGEHIGRRDFAFCLVRTHIVILSFTANFLAILRKNTRVKLVIPTASAKPLEISRHRHFVIDLSGIVRLLEAHASSNRPERARPGATVNIAETLAA